MQTLIGSIVPTSTLAIRIDDDLKRAALGWLITTASPSPRQVRAFCKQMTRTCRIPLTFASEGPNAEIIEAICEGDAFLTSGKGHFAGGDGPTAR